MDVFFQPKISDGIDYLDEEESWHCIKVLRKKKNDKITVFDGKGNIYKCHVREPNSNKCELQIIDRISLKNSSNTSIHIGISPTKSHEKLEWFIEKSIEIGLHKISIIICQNSERKKVNIERLEKKAISAMKQSQNPLLPEIYPPIKFLTFLDKNHENGKFIAYKNENNKNLIEEAGSTRNNLVVIGPEGDFSSEEINIAQSNGFIPVNLGKNRLRTETAGIVACNILNILNR